MPTIRFTIRYAALFFLLASTAAVPAHAAEQTPAKKITSIEGITEYRLDNGLTVLLYPDGSKPTVTVNLIVFVGSRHEGYGETGMAHLLEHMLFKGTPDHPAIPKALQDRGARFNGTTSLDRTNYFETLPATGDNLEFALDLEADRMVNSNVKREDLISEMTVVRNEFERGENSPPNLLQQRMMAAAFEWHNYGKSTIGNRSDIERVPIDKLKAFYVKYYQPDNAMLIVAGKFDPDKALKLVEKRFGTIPKPQRKLDKTYTDEPPQDGEHLVELRRVGDVGLVGALYHVPAGSHPDIAALDILSNVLAAEPSGRLYKALVETHKAAKIGAGVESLHDPGVFEIDAEVRKDDSLEAARDMLIEVAEKVADEEVTAEEVERARQQILKQRELAESNTSSMAVQLSNWASQGDWRLYFLYRDRIEKVTPDDVQAVARKYLHRNNRTVGLFIPTETTERVTVPAGPDLAKLLEGYRGREDVAAGEAFDVAPMSIESHCQRINLAEGVKAVLLPKKTRGEVVHLHLTLRYGNVENLKGLVAAADYLPALMLRGTKHLSRQQIQDELDKNRASLSASGDAGVITFSIQAKRANLPAVLGLLKQILREPALPGDELEVLRNEQLAGMETQLNDPQSRAALELRRTVSPYPKDDVRYVTTIAEEIERTKALKLEQIQKLYDEYLGAQAGEAAVVGDFEPKEITELLAEALSGWTAKQPYARIPKQVFPNVKPGQQTIETPDKANAVYVGGYVFPLKDSDADYAPLSLGNFVLGGGSLSSRLGDRIRQKEGLSYGVGSHLAADSFDPRASITLFAIFNPTNEQKVQTAIKEEIDRLFKDGVNPKELDQAKQGYLQKQQVDRASDGALTSILADTVYVGRTMKYYADLEKQIAAATPDAILAALKKHIDPKRLSIVVAGDFKGHAEESADGTGETKAEGASKAEGGGRKAEK